MSVSDWLKFEDRISIALTPAHFLAHLLDPHCHDCPHLTKEEISIAMKFLSEHNPSALPTVLKYPAKSSPFKLYMFKPEIVQNTDPLIWWKSQTSHLTVGQNTTVK